MPRHLIRRSPGEEEYLFWSTVVDAPVTNVMSRETAKAQIIYSYHWPNAEQAAELAEHLIQEADEKGCTGDRSFDYHHRTFWWRENAPTELGKPCEIEDEPGLFIGRNVSREELFEYLKAEKYG